MSADPTRGTEGQPGGRPGTQLVRHARALAAALALLAARGTPAQAPADSAAAAARARMASIPWTRGPAVGSLGTVAEVRVPATCRFTRTEGAKAFLELTENIPSGREAGLLLCDDPHRADDYWFVIYTYDASGYVRDDEKGKLDADAILASIRRGTEAANEERRSRGWDEMTVEGWVRPPHYDERTHDLTWSMSARSSRGGRSVNHSVRLLGRGGVLEAELVLSPEQLATAVPAFDSVMTGTTFVPGSRYAEWREGDRVASYGLTALIAGGAGAVAMKTGLLAKLVKVVVAFAAAAWKLVLAAVLGIGTMVRSLVSRKPKPAPDAPPPATPPPATP